jgi:hypothetical protein
VDLFKKNIGETDDENRVMKKAPCMEVQQKLILLYDNEKKEISRDDNGQSFVRYRPLLLHQKRGNVAEKDYGGQQQTAFSVPQEGNEKHRIENGKGYGLKPAAVKEVINFKEGNNKNKKGY